MKRLPVLFVMFLFVSLISVSNASARSVSGARTAPSAKNAQKPMSPTQMREMREKRRAMKKEMHDILLETLALIKEIAPDKGSKAKASNLEKRLQKHIDGMEAQHEMYMGHHGKRMKGMPR